jgi:predicted nucleic acid-binding protein
MDERKGRRMLDRLEISKIGTIGLLLRAKQERIIKSLRPELEKLRQNGFSLDSSLLEEVLKQAGE